jgi:BirA family transcriptional regulator, biotin operon repressor / biotin---[acetyl-CoA-carboxylase] ligase
MEVVPETGSTNADLAARLAAGERVPQGQWLVTDRQSAGKGRQGRVWFDGTGNFMGSTVVHLHRSDPPAGTLALVAGLAVHEAVSPHIPPPQRAVLKWPNDVMVGPAKLCGILLERAGDSVIVGIGVNLTVAPDPPDRATIALSAYGPPPSRNGFAEQLARHFDLELERWRAYGLEPLVARWQAAGHPPGTPLVAGEPGNASLTGTFVGLNPDGALQLRLADGSVRAIHAGEVRLAGEG